MICLPAACQGIQSDPEVKEVREEKKHYAELSIDADIPAGNIVFEKIKNDTVYVHQDLRDTSGDWFYWAFRVCGAQGKKLTFIFNRSEAVGVRGPIVSFDSGATYDYVTVSGLTRNKFTYTFPSDAEEVWMYECFPYLPSMWDAFVSGIQEKTFKKGVLCKSPKGVDVPCITIGSGKYDVVLSARHHCSEASADYVLEGVISAFAEDSELGRILRRRLTLTVVPFVDIDGSIAGDQGKNRKPHDHNRDYTEFIYPETAALAALMTKLKPRIFVDVHCPWLYGHYNEFIYTPWKELSLGVKEDNEKRFSSLIEKNQDGGLNYKASDDLPYGVSWNSNTNYSLGASSVRWALANIPSLDVCRSLEVPFQNANGAKVTPDALRGFGHGFASALLEFAMSR